MSKLKASWGLSNGPLLGRNPQGFPEATSRTGYLAGPVSSGGQMMQLANNGGEQRARYLKYKGTSTTGTMMEADRRGVGSTCSSS